MWCRRLYSTFKEGDTVLIRPLKNVAQAHLSRPLAKDSVVQTQHGDVHHNDIIGQPKRVFLGYRGKKLHKNQKDLRYIAVEPTLDEYTSMIKRRAQPIYSMDANVIVLLADIDVDVPEEGEKPKCFLEAGTGNGSLTISICGAIHGSNALARHYNDDSRRGAILYSIDRREDHLKMGAWNVHNYKRGRYIEDVEFGVYSLPLEWLKAHSTVELSGVFLDLPDPHIYFADIAKQMCLDATLIVFCPSVTQILRCREELADSRLRNDPIDLLLVKTVELPPGNGGGTREWDVNTAFTRETGEKVSVCRPKVGARVVGGGFVGIFKRLSVIGDSLQATVDAAKTKEIGIM
ncbi:CIC11C00000004765 [Sungouiella intermedia]|uniref:tRNA (adenine(58)-N(1))-methyltransferase catalytic subunit TRM61 n=1 Tax=Sungouiella intermedia TaxID=45354 RepID=A0A1L0CY43_9ASCO|nr:CIC11C00000004765 [[Candida] intermedia]